jgi:hypothetical protein
LKKFLIATAIATLVTTGAGIGIGQAKGPGPNGSNNHGLCTAYFNGSQNGQDHKHQAGPFQALEAAADDGNSSTSPEQDVWNWCNDTTNNPKGVGGNPTPPSG